MGEMWPLDLPGVLELPSGRRVRGRALRRSLPDTALEPTLSVWAASRMPPVPEWEMRWIEWRDFWRPADRASAAAIIEEAWEHAAAGRVEVACGGGVGRTGTILACLTALDGLDAPAAIAQVRRGYASRAVETPWQRRFVHDVAGGRW